MDDQSGFVLPFDNLRDDLVEGHHFHFNARSEELQRQVGGRQFAGNGDL